IFAFNGKSLENPTTPKWKVQRDGGEFDQFTGATISPRAIVKAIHKALQYYRQNRDWLFEKDMGHVLTPGPIQSDPSSNPPQSSPSSSGP
ncbi:MAG: FMN-binding protein, partial [Gammaproteobacteria bacterium]|nr:FMN-binding protein [Gammaproteobacteria bacterium]